MAGAPAVVPAWFALLYLGLRDAESIESKNGLMYGQASEEPASEVELQQTQDL